MGNSRWRLETSLNFLAARIHELGRQKQVEIVVADWGSEVGLHEVLDLTRLAARTVSFVPIPPEVARDVQKDSPFPEVLALNAAARRTKGEYIGRIDQDTLVGSRFIEAFFALYEGREQLDVELSKALLFANRRGIPYPYAVRCLPLHNVEQFVRWFGDGLPVARYADPFWASYVGMWLAHRDAWFACRGYSEELLYMNWMEVDMILRLLPSHTIVDLGELVGTDFYHLDHYSTAEIWAGQHRKVNPNMDLDGPREERRENDESWGLAQYPLAVVPYAPKQGPRLQTGARSSGERLRAGLALSSVGVRFAWERRSRPPELARAAGVVARMAWARRGDMVQRAADKARWELTRVDRGLLASTRERRVDAVKAAKAAATASGDAYDERPRVAVIVQSFNQEGNVYRLERRLRATGMDELIVCEDGSIDGSARRWADRLTGPNDFLLRSNDLHEIRTYHRAIEYTRAEVACLMQDDDRPPKDGTWLARAVRLFECYPALAVLGGCCGFGSYFDEVYNCPAWWRSPPRVEIPYREPFTQERFMFVEHVNIGPFLVRKDVYQRIGGFDHTFSGAGTPGICFESELCLRAWTQGYEVALMDIPVKSPYTGEGGTMLWGKVDRDRNEAQNHARLRELYDDDMPTIRERVKAANARLLSA